MAFPPVIAKNQTGSDIDLTRTGLRVPASSQLTLTDFVTYTECTEDESLVTAVTAGDIVINDGVEDLSTVKALDYLDASGSLDILEHPNIRQLIHFIEDGPGEGFADGPFTATTTGTLYPTLREWKNTSAELIASKAWDRSTGSSTNLKPSPITYKVYNEDGVTGIQAVDVLTYQGIYETSRTRTISTF